MTKEGTLYIVPTPIGNLGDMTLRGLEVLKSVATVLAEDTRTSSKLLRHYGVDTPLKAYHMHNEHRLVQELASRLQGGESMALISDAGTPGISDPGFLLVRECLRAGVKVECLPGATALVPALVSSGFPTDRFVFEGFLPPKKGRQKRLAALAGEARTLVFYESPHRLLKTLEQFREVFGPEREVSVSREMTKIHEETVRGTLDQVLTHFQASPPRGELVIAVRGAGA